MTTKWMCRLGLAIGMLGLVPAMAADIQPYQSKPIEPYQSKPVQPYQAKPVAPTQSPTVQPRAAQPVQPSTGSNAANNANAAGKADAAKTSAQNAKPTFGNWMLYVPSAAGPTGNASPGALANHKLTIKPDGSYEWTNPQGVQRGKWKAGDGAYPVVLPKSYEGKTWKVGTDLRTGELIVWDGMTHFKGRRA